jgi:hypothetical protein
MAEERPPTPPAGATAAEFAQRRFGGPTRLRSTTLSVGTTPTRLFQNNPRRVFWRAVNRSVNFGAIGFDQEFTAANGDLVGANGGSVSMDVNEDGEPVAWEVWTINDTAAGTWRLTEIERV